MDGNSPIPCLAWAILPKPMLMEIRFRVENLFTNLGMAHTCSSIWEEAELCFEFEVCLGYIVSRRPAVAIG